MKARSGFVSNSSSSSFILVGYRVDLKDIKREDLPSGYKKDSPYFFLFYYYEGMCPIDLTKNIYDYLVKTDKPLSNWDAEIFCGYCTDQTINLGKKDIERLMKNSRLQIKPETGTINSPDSFESLFKFLEGSEE